MADLIADLVPLDGESLFSALCVFLQRAVSETKAFNARTLVNHIDDTARI